MALECYPWQTELKATLNGMRGALPNAVLVYGPRGIGTVDFVIEFVKSLFCEKPGPDGSPCGQCPGCALARAYTHPDIAYVLSESEAVFRHIPFEAPEAAKKDRKLYREILIHQVRALTDFLNLTTHRTTGRRAVVVYPADALRVDSASTILKSLEEPPENTTFFLVADNIDKVLPTIRSRSRLVRTRNAVPEEAAAFLSMQGFPHPEEVLRRHAGQPLTPVYMKLIEQDDSLDKKVREELLGLGVLSDSARDDLLGALSMGGSMPLNRIAIRDGRSTPPVSVVANVISQWGHDLILAQRGLPVRFNPQYAEAIADVSRMARPEALYAWLDMLKNVKATQTHPLNAQLVIEQVLIAYKRMAQGKSI